MKNWETSMPKMDPFYEGLTIVGEYEHDGIVMKLARKRIKRLITFGKRDFTFVSVSDRRRSRRRRGNGRERGRVMEWDNNNVWVSGTVSVETEWMPRQKGYVRAYQDSIAFYGWTMMQKPVDLG